MLNTLVSRARTKLYIITGDSVWNTVVNDVYEERETRLMYDSQNQTPN